jgi:DnaK suppressor protein
MKGTSMPRKMNKKEKDEFRRLLAAKKESIIRKLTDTITESKEMESNVAQDLVDKAETSYTKEFLLSLSDGEREQLLLIDEALKRLEHGEFGVCQLCQKEIGAKRLEAIPWTPYCINCQEKAEEELRAQ